MTSLILLTGLPGAGKSVVAERLAKKYEFAILSTDELRELLFKQNYVQLKENGLPVLPAWSSTLTPSIF